MDKKDNIHPEDSRNLIIFIVLAIGIWLFFDSFVMKPHMDAINAAKQAEAEQMGDATALVAPNSDTGLSLPSEAIEALGVEEALAQAPRVKIDTPSLKGSLSLKGGRLDDLKLKNHFRTLDKKENVGLLSPSQTPHGRYIDIGWLASSKTVKTPTKDTVWTLASLGDLTPSNPVRLVWDNGSGLRFERNFTIDENFMVTVVQTVQNTGIETVSLFPYGLVAQNNIPEDFQGRFISHEGPLGYLNEELIERSYKKAAKKGSEEFKASQGWIGISDKYWFTSLIPEQEEQKTFRVAFKEPRSESDFAKYQVDYLGQGYSLPAGEKIENTINIFSGAKQLRVLQDYEESLPVKHFDLAVDFGIYYFLTKPLFSILTFFNHLTGNMGIAIIILTFMVRAAVFPLANTSFRSFAKMKKISPKMAELRETYGDDKQRLQSELVKLYEKEKVNPMMGCLPILIQIPIFFALYKTFLVTIEMRHEPFFGWISDLSAPDPTNIFTLFGLIPWDPPSMLHFGIWPCLLLIAMVYQRKLNPPPQDPMQAMVIKWMPFMMAWILAKFPAGLVIYWTLSNTLSMVQQAIIMKSMGVEIYLFKSDKEREKMEKMVAEGPGVHPELEVLEHDAQDALDELVTPPDGKVGDDEPPKVTPPKRKKSKKKK